MYKILVAEDESIERRVLCKTLSKYFPDRCTILEARNGREALDIARQERPQVAILDIEMPGVSGLEAARQIRQLELPCVILFLTAYDSFSYARQAISVRALDYLLKPYDEKELVLSVEAAMDLADKLTVFPKLLYPPQTATELPPKPAEKEDNVRLSYVRERIQRYIDENYATDLSLQTTAHALNYSDAYFCKLFKQCFRVNFSAYLNEYRVDKAKQLLQDPDLGIRDVSEACGYADSSYFSRVFKRITGATPSEYRVNVLKPEI